MALHEPLRSSIFHKLEQLLGTPEAIALMNELPPVDWPDVATKSDLATLATKADLAALDARLAVVEHEVARIGKLEDKVERIGDRIDRLVYTMVGTQFAAIGLAFAAARLGAV